MIQLLKKHILPLLLLAVLVADFACAGASRLGGQSAPSRPGRYSDDAPASEIEGAAGMSDYGARRDRERAEESGEEQAAQKQPAERMVVYSADYRLGVESVRKTIESVKDMTVRHGGFIESINTSDSYRAAKIVARVPVAKFNESLDEVDRLGTVERKTVSASDVTMQFQDTVLRVETARKVRERLHELLKRVEKAGDKVDILREMARITAEIDNMTAEMEYLRSRAAFSTLALDLRALVRDVARRYIASPFRWIAGLDPVRRSIVHGSDGDLVFEAPPGYFNFTKDYFRTSGHSQNLIVNSTDTVRMRLGVTDNYPRADQKFWVEAVKIDFENRMYEVKKADTVQARGVVFNRFLVGLPAGEFYTVAFAVKDKKIIVFECHVKDEKTLGESGPAVEGFIKSVGYDE